MKPQTVNILGLSYQIQYVNNPSDVDIFKRESLWGQIDHWTRTIRVYDNNRTAEDIFQTILHEVLHGIGEALHLSVLTDENAEHHDQLDILALAITDVLVRNNWITLDDA